MEVAALSMPSQEDGKIRSTTELCVFVSISLKSSQKLILLLEL